MTHKTRQNFRINIRRQEVIRQYSQRKKEDEIAESLGVSQATISRDLKFLMESWKKETAEGLSNILFQELIELDYMEREAAINYELAKPRTYISNEGKAIPLQGSPHDMQKWLLIRLKIKERRAELLGLDQPQKLKVDAPGLQAGGQVTIYIPENFRDIEAV